MCPEISCFYIPNLEKLRGFDSIFKETYKGFNFFNILPMKHFVNLEKRILKGENLHYYNEILKTAGVNSCDFKSQSPIVSERVKQSVLDKVSKIGLNTENFVFLCPESQSNLNPKDCFWADVINRFYSEGFDVFMNVMKLTPLYGTAKTCFLTMEEAYYLASLSKCIVGLRSGVMEPLTAINDIPILCLYSDFKDRGVLKSIPAEKVMSCFSLKNLPNASDNIYEYTFEQVNSDCIDKLISEVKF